MKNSKSKGFTSLFAFAMVMVLVFTSIISASANPDSVIDFEGLPEGSIVSSVSYGNGISGEAVPGVVSVFGFNPVFGPGTNAAMIFDAACLPLGTPAGCTGGDSDLFWPEGGNVLIISEDLDSSDPDDADVRGAVFRFDFSNWGTGKVTVHNITVMDVETEEAGDASVKFFSGGFNGTLLGELPIPETGNGQHKEILFNFSGVDAMEVDLDGSGAITNISITPDVITPPTLTSTPTQTPTATPTEPTAVELLYFRVDQVVGQQVKLAWATSAEIDHYGYRLYRSPDNNFAHADLIHFQAGARNVAGSTYAFTDTVPNSGSWWYWLADIDNAGRETLDPAFSPVFADVVSNQPVRARSVVFLPLTITRFKP